MNNTDELRYVQAFARIIGVKEDDALEYAQRKGIGALVENATQLLSTPAQRERHQAFLDLYRMSSNINTKNPIINSPDTAADFFRSVMDQVHDKEAFVVAFLNTKNRVIDHEVVSLGTINSSIVHPREVFRNAIVNKANAVILCHNHPSGDLTPSSEDLTVTKRLKETGNLLGIQVLDHLIINGINQQDHYSFQAHGVLEAPAAYGQKEAVRESSAQATSGKNIKDGLKEITDKLEQGIRDFFSGDKYQDYLRTMSRFHHYSLNNTILIAMQKPDATLVAGYNRWQDQFQRNVLKGEKGIRIIAPAPVKTKKEVEKLDPVTQKPLRDVTGKTLTEEVEIKIPRFRVVSVFDVSQTDGKPLPQLASTLTGDVKQYDVFMEALKRSSPVPIFFEAMSASTDGYFSQGRQKIAIRDDMSEIQTVSAAIHEIAHAKLHNLKPDQAKDHGEAGKAPEKPKDRRTEEVEAESVSFAVCAYYGIATDENSFGYIAAWSKDKDLPELKASLETISKTSALLIDDIDRHFKEITQEREITAADIGQLDERTGTDENPSPRLQEVEFLTGPDDTYAIYQLKNDENLRNHQFESLHHLEKLGLTVDYKNYDLTYTGHFEAAADTNGTLNGIYEKFNEDYPKDFTGHSLSMSDVIVLKQHGDYTAHYVDAIGFKEVPEFLKPINPLRSIEDTVEQNDNQFDGLINNVPTKDSDKTREAVEGPEEKKPQKESVKQRLKKSSEKPELSKTPPHKTAEMER
jgi:DNA repair protein RadC